VLSHEPPHSLLELRKATMSLISDLNHLFTKGKEWIGHKCRAKHRKQTEGVTAKGSGGWKRQQAGPSHHQLQRGLEVRRHKEAIVEEMDRFLKTQGDEKIRHKDAKIKEAQRHGSVKAKQDLERSSSDIRQHRDIIDREKNYHGKAKRQEKSEHKVAVNENQAEYKKRKAEEEDWHRTQMRQWGG
jgi:hypothetical protein